MLIHKILLFFGFLTYCDCLQWLMEGDLITDNEASSRNLILESNNSTTSVSSSMFLTLTSPHGYKINCIIAAAIHLNGNVSLISGGIGLPSVSLAYDTMNGLPDSFYVMIQSHAEKIVKVKDYVARGSKVTIVFDKTTDWMIENRNV